MHLKFWKNTKLRSDRSFNEMLVLLMAECSGTAMFVFIGCLGPDPQLPKFQVGQSALTFAFGFMLAIQCVAHISGAHLNPILSLNAILVGRISVSEGMFYFLGQFLGGILGFGLLRLQVPSSYIFGSDDLKRKEVGFCAGVIQSVGPIEAVFIEFAASFIFVLVFCSFFDYRNRRSNSDSYALKFGFTLLGLSMACAPFTGCHINPARSFAPALIQMHWGHFYVYFAGPVLGSIVGSILYAVFFLELEQVTEL